MLMNNYDQYDLDGLDKIRLKKIIKAPVRVVKKVARAQVKIVKKVAKAPVKVVKTGVKVTKKVAKSKVGKVALAAGAIYGGYLLAPKILTAIGVKGGTAAAASAAAPSVTAAVAPTVASAIAPTLIKAATSTASFVAPIAQEAIIARMAAPSNEPIDYEQPAPGQRSTSPRSVRPGQAYTPAAQGEQEEASFTEKLMNTIIPTASASDDGKAPEKLPPWALPAMIGGGVVVTMLLKKRRR